MAELTEAMLGRLIDALERDATANAQLANAVQNSTASAEKRQEAIMEEIVAMQHARDDAVAEIKASTKADLDARELWWRKTFKLGIVAFTIATLLNVPLRRVLATMLHLK